MCQGRSGCELVVSCYCWNMAGFLDATVVVNVYYMDGVDGGMSGKCYGAWERAGTHW